MTLMHCDRYRVMHMYIRYSIVGKSIYCKIDIGVNINNSCFFQIQLQCVHEMTSLHTLYSHMGSLSPAHI